MEYKRLLRFYFTADNLDKALNNLITRKAVSSAKYGSNVEIIGQEMCTLIQVKEELSEFWNYLDSVIKPFSEDELKVLRFYGTTRVGIKQLPPDTQKEIKKVFIKFTRHAHRIDRYEKAIRLVNRYYGLM